MGVLSGQPGSQESGRQKVRGECGWGRQSQDSERVKGPGRRGESGNRVDQQSNVRASDELHLDHCCVVAFYFGSVTIDQVTRQRQEPGKAETTRDGPPEKDVPERNA